MTVRPLVGPVSLLLLACGGGEAAVAGPLLIAPTTIEIDADRRGSSVQVTNASDEPTDLQLRVFNWSQDAAGEHLTTTTDLRVSPPIATLPPHGRQVFRILDLSPRADGGERSFRIKLNELPRPTRAPVSINVEFSLPVFITPETAITHLGWTMTPTSLTLTNEGTRRAHLSGLHLAGPDGGRVALPDAHGAYILAGSSRRFPLPPGFRIGPGMRLTGVGDAGAFDVPLSALAIR